MTSRDFCEAREIRLLIEGLPVYGSFGTAELGTVASLERVLADLKR